MLARLGGGRTPAPGLCASCRYLELIESRHSVFVSCGLAPQDPHYRRNPRLPMLECGCYLRTSGGGAPGG